MRLHTSVCVAVCRCPCLSAAEVRAWPAVGGRANVTVAVWELLPAPVCVTKKECLIPWNNQRLPLNSGELRGAQKYLYAIIISTIHLPYRQ